MNTLLIVLLKLKRKIRNLNMGRLGPPKIKVGGLGPCSPTFPPTMSDSSCLIGESRFHVKYYFLDYNSPTGLQNFPTFLQFAPRA